MASRQQFKEDRAEAAAKLAAKDIGDINRANESEEGYTLHSDIHFKQARAEAAAKLAAKDLEEVNRAKERAFQEQQRDYDEQKPGVIGSMFRAAKEAVVGKPQEHEVVRDRDRSPGVYDSTKQKAGEYADYASEKAKETKDATMEKMNEAKDATTNKAGEYKDYAGEKMKDAKDTTMNKAGEYKDYTAEKAKEGKDSTVGKLGELKDRAMGFFTGKKDETKDAMERTKEKVTEEEARRRMEGVRVEDNDHRGGPVGGKIEIRMEESRPGVMADALRAADKAINDAERGREKM